jgi:hypothetical protein
MDVRLLLMLVCPVVLTCKHDDGCKAAANASVFGGVARRLTCKHDVRLLLMLVCLVV